MRMPVDWPLQYAQDISIFREVLQWGASDKRVKRDLTHKGPANQVTYDTLIVPL